MIYGASSFDCKLWMREGDSAQRQALYDLHLRQYTESKVAEIVNAKPIISAIEHLAREEMSEFYKLPKKTHQILFCVHCAASDICGPQGAHTCSGVAETMEEQGISTGRERWALREDESVDLKNPRTLKRMKRTRDSSLGVVNFKILYAHELYEHDHLVDLSGITDETLSERGLVWLDPTPHLKRLAVSRKYGDMIPTDILSVPRILVHQQSSDHFIETVGVYRLIQTRASAMPVFDHRVPHAAQVPPKLLEAVLAIVRKSKGPGRRANCPSGACSYLSLRGTLQGQQQPRRYISRRQHSRRRGRNAEEANGGRDVHPGQKGRNTHINGANNQFKECVRLQEGEKLPPLARQDRAPGLRLHFHHPWHLLALRVLVQDRTNGANNQFKECVRLQEGKKSPPLLDRTELL
jgi:hypothetical protein